MKDTPHHTSLRSVWFGGVLLLCTVVATTALTSRAVLLGDNPLDAAVTHIEPGPADSTHDETIRVLVFYDPNQMQCTECALHVWRFAYYSYEFQRAGAEVLGVATALRDGRAQVDDSLELPWSTVYDLSGQMGRYYDVRLGERSNPAIIVTRGDQLLFRGQPEGVDDRLEGNVLTTILAARSNLPLDGVVARAHSD